MFNPDLDPVELHKTYAANSPFPHIAIDDFLDTPTAKAVAKALDECDISTWSYDTGVLAHQVNKRWLSDLALMPPVVASTLAYFNSQPALDFIATLTGIPNLIPDPRYVGGGIHVTETGGKLDVHADFNIHPETGFHRRVNALLYLNEGWKSEWLGQLELYNKDMEPEVVIDPILNRLAVFTITDDALHGVPRFLACPTERKRFSLALYYYTIDRPEEEKAPFHWADWHEV